MSSGKPFSYAEHKQRGHVQATVWLKKEEHEALEALALALGVTKSEAVRRAIAFANDRVHEVP